jgi:hypothetical protein
VPISCSPLPVPFDLLAFAHRDDGEGGKPDISRSRLTIKRRAKVQNQGEVAILR